jgi:VWFA-related protein
MAFFRDKVIPAMARLREAGDSLETIMPHGVWPLPTYREMLFIKSVSLFQVRSEGPGDAVTAAGGVFSNRVQSPSNGGVVAIVFDRLNTSWANQVEARDHIVKYLGQVRPDDRIALYVLAPDGMRVIHDFTKDARSLLRALEGARARASQPLQGSQAQAPEHVGFGDSVDAQMDAFVRASFENMRAFYDRSRAYTSLQALEDVAAHLAGVPGRKNLVWVSSGFPFTITESGLGGTTSETTMSSETRRAARALNNSDIAVYPIDARGLIGAFSTPPSARVQQFATIHSTMRAIDGLRTVADWTGGRAFYNTNDLGAAIAGAVDDSRLTYILGYYPAHDDWDSTFRTISVKVRRRGVEVRHRTGYFATPVDAAAPMSGSGAIRAALDSPLEATGLSLSVRAEAAADDRILLTLQFDPSVVTLRRNGGKWTGGLDVTVAQTLATREHIREVDVTLPLSLTDDMREDFLLRGLSVTRTIRLRPDAHQVRVVARDVASGTIGSVIITASEIRR